MICGFVTIAVKIDIHVRVFMIILTLSVCHVDDIRLTGTGSSVSRGNVELCINNHFNAICGNVWSSNDAKVVCRQLGFNSSKFTLHTALKQKCAMHAFRFLWNKFVKG